MRKWQRGRKPSRREPPNPENPPLQPAYPELSGPESQDAPEEKPAAQTAEPGAPQRRKRGGRRRNKPAQPQAGAEPPAETKAAPEQPKPRREKPSKPARGRSRRGGARKPAPPAELPSAPEEQSPALQPAYPELVEAEPAPPAEAVPEAVQEAAPPPVIEVEPPAQPEAELVPEQQTEIPPDFAPELTTVAEPPRSAPVAAPAARPHRAPKGVVVLAVGLPGSGKTTWFKRRGVTPLSSDLLRTLLFDNITEQRYQNLVFGTLRSLLRARLIARMPWNYVDATNLSPKERRHWIQMSRDFGFEVHAVFFDVPLEVCLERNRRRERVVPEDIMHRMAAKLRPPRFEEGFSKITVVRVKKKEGEG